MNEPAGAFVERLDLFAVPLVFARHIVPPALRDELAVWVLAERAADPGVRRSNVGGWHSKPDLPVRGVPVLDRLLQAIVEQVRRLLSDLGPDADYRARCVLQAWATVMEGGDHVAIHDHADAHWSAVYYVDAGDADDDVSSGRISWINPIGAVRSMPGVDVVPTTFVCTPRSGLLVLFPGWLRHSVEPYQGSRPRIAIAANIEVQRARA